MRNNPFRYSTPPGWNDMSTAPRDGTWIEVQNNWGVAAWFGRYRWTDEHSSHDGEGNVVTFKSQTESWQDGKGGGVSDGPHLSWRPTSQEGEYHDPLGGLQNTRAYWLRAAGFNPASYGAVDGETWEQEAARKVRSPASADFADSPLFFGLLAFAAFAGLAAIFIVAF